jgi:hypothetical protein
MSASYEQSILVSRAAHRQGLGFALLLAGMGVFHSLVRGADDFRDNANARKTGQVHLGIGVHDVDIGLGLLPQG